ncbi:NAD(P)-binding protein [Pseudoalteromonas sp. RW-H-Ap-1]|uniref:NAD(P)-binding protein n=1 Tax=Pseudoalteromonas sp. RW-H-Ap-1 TaxID=3241171 RepID=UPI003AABD559
MTHPFIKNYAYNTQVKAESDLPKSALPKTRVGILGGGTAGATIAIRLAALGIKTTIFEKKSHLLTALLCVICTPVVIYTVKFQIKTV